MRYLILTYIFFFNFVVVMARPGAFLLIPLPQPPAPQVVLEWFPNGWDVMTLATDSRTFTLHNTGGAISGPLNITFTFGFVFSKNTDGCSFAVLLPGGTCDVTIDFNGINDTSLYFLGADDGNINTLIDATMHYCPGC